ncbi:hypothetical protein JY651_38130 [Pyxidicoccus parkwayensis]|uniref:Uncharacterized protein n=1 Tax=Pyxidicoccus parkwayensis TaxID=2813578 RepID=A0ABX7NQ56_9BACT|nr:hypothetical protein [Pyxidicoccus parkwaysis]QSQ20982.1 hypothetical protein JY651_38130 [Pyxidicoccus parkwaysis]
MNTHSGANASPIHAITSGLFLLAALFVGGGALGLTVGVLVDKSVNDNGHGFPGLGGLLMGTPVGALLGFGLGLLLLRRQSHAQRVRTGAVGLGVAAACALGMFGAVQLGLMSW